MKTTTKTLLAACLMALASGATMAAEAGAGDRGAANQVGPQSPSDTPPGRSSQYSEATRTARDSYKDALQNCRSMSGSERTQCRRDARTARDQALNEARQPTSMYAAPAAGTTPADRADARMANSPSQKNAATKP